jgi:arylsulfatase A-like enzyme
VSVRVAAQLVAASILLALVDAAAIALTLPLPASGSGLRVAHHLFDAAEAIGVGALAAAAASGTSWLLRRAPWFRAALAVAVMIALAYPAIGENLRRFSSLTLGGRFEDALFVLYCVLVPSSVYAAYRFAAYVSHRPRLRLLVVFFALAVLAVDHAVAPGEYPGIHGLVAWGAALMGGTALAPLVERAITRAASTWRGRAALGAFAAVAIAGVVAPPPNVVRCELFREPCAVAPWALATALWKPPSFHAPAPPAPTSVWYQSPTARASVAPTSPRLLANDAVVVLVTIDAVRADAVLDPANDALFPTFTALKRDGVSFRRASAPASQTALSLATLFSGRTFSEQLWTDHGEGMTRFLYPADDRSVRFPEILSAHGIGTASFGSLVFLANEFGVARGFHEENVVVTGNYQARAVQLIDPLVARLNAGPRGPLFLYTHLMEPHAPYDLGRPDGSERERYLSEVALTDAAVRSVLEVLQASFGDRWMLIVTSDHGEAFGEHAARGHATTLYEELLHVPLLVRSPRIAPRQIDEPVGLVDLGPTILDLFGIDTPPTFLGQSLVPLLAGRSPVLARPLFAEGRLRRSLRFPDGRKIIEDERRKLVEVYDLSADPGETRNIFDREPARADDALAALRAFFAAHTRTEGGYEPPYKP